MSLESKKQFELELDRTKSNTTKKLYMETINRFDKWLDNNSKEPSQKSVREFLNDLHGQGLASSSQNRHLSALKTYFRKMRNEELAVESTQKSEKEKRPVIEGEDYPNPEKVKELIRNLDGKFLNLRDRAIFCVGFGAGARRGEIVRADREHFDPPHITILRGKTRGNEVVDHRRKLGEELSGYIQEYLDARSDNNEALFITRKNDGVERPHPNTIFYMVKKRTGQFLGKKYNPHALRHARASQMARKGVPMKHIADYLGITTDVADRTYSHLTQREMDEVPTAMS
ncbi:hypothetical protein AKJ52_02750 [candidate division MSBL1 archaeon SCGC-AAA382C18]|uniref:Tyr recombinase domain-containing protein n=1 Tax=candidate division MSBL1 archaeon SCGC-AAA382C18 TaxID=1698281 RepID=A0A133VHP3_9EURY|nr:hypothetical protein AKJ52_02750 [candidate division MSBL1 archaeon SCGC-AAA382C18]